MEILIPMIHMAVMGSTGRMGKEILSLLAASSDCIWKGGTGSGGIPHLPPNNSQLMSSEEGSPRLFLERLLGESQVAIDFSVDTALPLHLSAAVTTQTPLVIGTTGTINFEALHKASHSIPIFYAANFSLGIAVLQKLAQMAATWFPSTYDLHITDSHHRHKKDAPSGTALSLYKTVSSASDTSRQIILSSVRGGGIMGEHTLRFLGPDEEVTLTHRTAQRKLYAQGALQAARWLTSQKPGLYGMDDLLGSSLPPVFP